MTATLSLVILLTAAENEPLAGWPGVFPELQGYARTFEKPVLDKEGKDYGQTARYEWTGGVIKALRLTAVRSGRTGCANRRLRSQAT